MPIACGRHLRRVTFVLLAFWISLDVSAAGSRQLRNDEFRFSVTIPSSAVSCDEATGGHPDGFSILLEPMNQGCQSRVPQPYVGLFANYNVIYAKTAAAAIRGLCPSLRSKSPAINSSALAYPGHPSAVCDKKEDNGWIDVFVVAQAGRWPDRPKSNMPYVNYTAQLHTTPERLTKDLTAFEQILAGVKITSARDLEALMRAAQPPAAPHVSS